jgi:hypothetical protein
VSRAVDAGGDVARIWQPGAQFLKRWKVGVQASDEVRVDERRMYEAHGDTEVGDLLAVCQREHFDACFACGVCGESG